MSDDLERGKDVKTLEEGGWLIYWNGTPDGWLRCREPAQLRYWR